jgi:hypothetical protein
MKLSKRELDKPIDFMAGEYPTLRELKDRPGERGTLILTTLSEQNLRDLVLKRYESEPRDKMVHILGEGRFTVDQLEREIRNGTKVGKLAMEAELDWIKYLKEKLKANEIEEVE